MPYPWGGNDALTAADLNAAIAAAASGTLSGHTWTTGSVIFSGASGLAQDNANLFWDDTNNRLGIGTAIPQAQFHIGATAATARIYNNLPDASNSEWAYMPTWGKTSNVATYGTDKNGTGTIRNIEFTVGGTRKLDYGIGAAAAWTFQDAILSTAAVIAQSATAIPAGGTAGVGLKFSSTAGFGVFFGSGAPTLSAAKGSYYARSDGSGTNNRGYINTDGGTTWTAVVTVA